MQTLIDDYGQSAAMMVFGAGLIMVMGMFLRSIVSGKMYLKDFAAMSGLEQTVRSNKVNIIRGDTVRNSTFENIDFFEYRGREQGDSDR